MHAGAQRARATVRRVRAAAAWIRVGWRDRLPLSFKKLSLSAPQLPLPPLRLELVPVSYASYLPFFLKMAAAATMSPATASATSPLSSSCFGRVMLDAGWTQAWCHGNLIALFCLQHIACSGKS